MVAPALVAATSLHDAPMAAMLAAAQVVRAYQTLGQASGTVIVTQNLPAFPKIHLPCFSHPAASEEGV
jgi:hypothetical protein